MKKDDFVQGEWAKLCSRLAQTAVHLGSRTGHKDSFLELAEAFGRQPPPAGYQELLGKVREAAEMAIGWQAAVSDSPDVVDEAAQESFPASDPPAWNHTRM